MRLVQLVEQQLRIVRKPLAVDCLLDHDYFLNYLLRMLFDKYGISHIMGHVTWAMASKARPQAMLDRGGMR